MNKKTEKILIGLGLGLLGIIGVVKFVKAYKKGVEELENQETKETEDLESAGINTSKLREKTDDEEKDFSRMLYVATRYNSDIDLDMLEINGDPERGTEGVLDCIDEKVIHVRQIFDTKPRYGESGRRVEFRLDIPDYTSDSYRGPKIGDFLSTFKKAADYMSSSIVKFSSPARQKLFGFVIISRKDSSGDTIVEYRQLTEDVYGEYAVGKHDGLTDFYKQEKIKFNHIGVYDYIKEADWLFKNCPDLDREDETILIENIILQYIISFPIRSNKPGELYGIDVKSAIECIKYMTDEMEVKREDSNKIITYQNLLFHAPNKQGIPDMSWYYTVDEETDNIVINNLIFKDEDDD